MNKTLKRLLVAALALSATQLSAHTNQTYLNARSHGVNIAMDQTAAWEARDAKEHDAFGGTLSVTGFYTDSGAKGDLGKYFLFGNAAQQTVSQVTLLKFINNIGAGDDTTIKLNPSQTAYGVALSYHQKLCKIVEGLYFDVKLPIVRVENDMGLSTGGTSGAQVKQLLNGTYSSAVGAVGAQANLSNAIMNGKRNATGVADIDLMLGYSFLRKESYHASINLGLTIPTGNKADGKYAFQPIYGNGNHFGFGGGLDFFARIWGDHHTNFKLHAAANFRYLFEATEKRTLGITGKDFGQYQSVLLATDAAAGTPGLVAQLNNPAANYTTLNVGVTPGSQLDGLLALTYNNGGLSLDLGYNLYFREDEDVKSKFTWNDAQYALVDNHTNPAVAIAMNTAAGANTVALMTTAATKQVVPLTGSMLNLQSARTPSQFSNKIYGSVGYLFREWEYPVFVAAGAHYEFASSNSVVENWGINGKVGISF